MFILTEMPTSENVLNSIFFYILEKAEPKTINPSLKVNSS